MSIQQNFPAISPSLNLNFARSKTLDPRITFSRTSTATRVNEQGLVEVVSADIPRFDHEYDASTGVVKSLGLLVEEQRTNSLYYSNDFSQDPLPATAVQGWFKQSSHPVPTQSVVGPDGVSNSGWRFYRTATNQYILQQVAGAGTHTLSAWVRSSAATGSFTMQGYNSTDKTMATLFTATNEWQRFSITISPTTTTNYYPCIPTNINTDFYVWGAQLELNKSFETSYIPTSGSTATREPDNASITGDNFSDVYNQEEGSYKVEGVINGSLPANTYGGIFGAGSGGGSGTSNFIFYNPGTSFGQYVSNTGQSPAAALGKTYTVGSKFKISASYATNDFACSLNGDISTSTTSNALYKSHTYFRIGSNPISFAVRGAMTISNISYYSKQITDTQLQNLTK